MRAACAGPQAPVEAAPLLELTTSLANALQTASNTFSSSSSGSSSKKQTQQVLAALASRVCKAMQRLGQGSQAGKLASCYRLTG